MVIIKKIISFEKELLFKTKVSEITSISLEHHISKIEEDLISGNFIINGDYKMNEGSIVREKFDFDVGFDIALDNRFDTKNMIVDIDDFTYHIINEEILAVKIDLFIEGDLINEDVVILSNPDKIIETKQKIDLVRDDKPDKDIDDDVIVERPVVDDSNTLLLEDNIFGNINENETYATYYVYIVKEDDSLDKIMEKYGVSKDDIEMYNTIDNILPGDKIIIPATNGE